jgi:hypothetical protein
MPCILCWTYIVTTPYQALRGRGRRRGRGRGRDVMYEGGQALTEGRFFLSGRRGVADFTRYRPARQTAPLQRAGGVAWRSCAAARNWRRALRHFGVRERRELIPQNDKRAHRDAFRVCRGGACEHQDAALGHADAARDERGHPAVRFLWTRPADADVVPRSILVDATPALTR